jgi:uncharacterized membrane protein required for colicin V production
MNLNLDALPVNAFDLLLLGVVALGLARGRKRGMSEELLGVLQWLVIVLLCAVLYEPAGLFIGQFTTLFGRLSCFLVAYLGVALVVVGLFALLKRTLGGKLLGSDVFGRGEYYLGMSSGVVRAVCILIAGLALLNARYFSPTEVRAMEKFQDDMYGSNFFPTLHTVQATVFDKSLTGPWIKENLGFLLIKPTEPDNRELHQKDFVGP